ncbi:hypothetical protein O181_050506 [Austropuccinia psidii MF-1]|uniref:Ornithine decarboxylase n=1 Tax=Austropuccinia psidii MF-1 TaxID=1389203 RepID=A0A9Q3HMF3_9BASI|nr:hypothetical protein [Austropuccinia psidii MF-1]
MTAILPRLHLGSAKKSHSNHNSHKENLNQVIHSGPAIEVFRSLLSKIDINNCQANGENAFYICDLACVYNQFNRWKSVFSNRVDAFFAVKCNPDIQILKLFSKLGMGFDCASNAEINLVLSLGVSPNRIIYANPCKASSFIRHAHANGIQLMTFDNSDELEKIAKFHPAAKLVIRIITDDSKSMCRFGEKFGAPLDSVQELLQLAVQLNLNVVGVAFHVGSGCSSSDSYIDAIRRAKSVFEIAQDFGLQFDLLDIGGGFNDDNFESLADGVLVALNQYFPIGCGVRVIAEPGRYFVSRAFELATNIIARRQAPIQNTSKFNDQNIQKEQQRDPLTLYYINDGVYGAFNCIMFDHQVVNPKILTLGGVFYGDGFSETGYPNSPMTPSYSEHEMDSSTESIDPSSIAPKFSPHQTSSLFLEADLKPCKIFGPSCDSIDVVCPIVMLPVKHLKVGDWMRWTNMGAYTICAASQFNGFKISQVKYTIGDHCIEDELRTILDH